MSSSVLVTGASGLLGLGLVPELVAHGWTVSTSASDGDVDVSVDLTDSGEVRRLIDSVRPDLVVNLVGLTDVDLCERDPDLAYRVNTLTAENLARAVDGIDCHLVHVSTDQVYDGSGPHREDDVTIRNHYALSKYAGELALRGTSATILRTNFFGQSRRPGPRSFTDWLYEELTQGRSVGVFTDVFFSPLSITTLSSHIDRVLRATPVGVFNLGGLEGLSKADFAVRFAAAVGLPASSLNPRKSSAAGLLARRPVDMRMDCGKFERVLQVQLPTVDAEILRVAERYR